MDILYYFLPFDDFELLLSFPFIHMTTATYMFMCVYALVSIYRRQIHKYRIAR